MSKELLVAGAVVVVCLGVTAVALVKPKAAATDATTAATTDAAPVASHDGTPPVDAYDSGASFAGSPSSLTPPDHFGRDNSTFPPSGADLNPNRPFDSSLPGASTGGLGTTPLPPAPVDGDLFAPIPPPLPVTPVDGALTGPAVGDAAISGGGPREHVVKKGETFSDISKQHYGTVRHWREIQKANAGVAEDGLKVGDRLVIPEIAAPTAAATATDAGGAGLYVVKKNDTLYQIAKRELGDASRYKEIQRLNNLQPDDLREGMKLKLPAKGGSPAAAQARPDPELPAGAKLHTVAKDEYIIDISKKHYGSTKHWREIAKANPGVDPERLKVGQKLVIPARGGAAATGGGAAAEPVAGEGEYVIKAGDTYPRLAERLLGDARKWKEFSAANPGVDPQRLRIGQKIRLPAGARGERPAPSIPAPSSEFDIPAPLPLPAPSTPVDPVGSFPIAPASSDPFPVAPTSSDPFPGASTPAGGVSSLPGATSGDTWDAGGSSSGRPAPAPGADVWGVGRP